MGLLEKAAKVLEGRPIPGTGINERVANLREKDRRPGQPSATKKGGLFERARRLREKVRRPGLYGQALHLREGAEREGADTASSLEASADSLIVAKPPEPVSGKAPPHSGGLLGRAEALKAVDAVVPESQPVLAPITEAEADDLLFSQPEFSESLSSLEVHDFAETEGTTEAPIPEQPALSGPFSSESGRPLSEPALDFVFEERSPSEFDPGLTEEVPEAISDPFREWEEEAGRQAEKEAHDILGTGHEPFLSGEDEGIATMPVEAHIASQKRIDDYLALFELNKELNSIDHTEEFWDAVLYSILGQIGARSVLIFAGKGNEQATRAFYPVACSGVPVSDSWNLKPGDAIYERLSKSEEIRYAGEFLAASSGISESEREILEKGRAVLLLPLKHRDKYDGIVLIGAPLESADYSIEELEYLRLLPGNILGSLERISNIAKHAEETETLRKENELHRSLSELAASAQTRKSVDEIYDLLLEFYSTGLGVDSLSLVLLDPPEQLYRIFAGNRISPATLQKFRLPVGSSELIGTISNLSGIFNLVDFRTHPEIIAGYAGDDLALMQHYWILPLINLNWLVGFLTIHRTGRNWTDLDREVALMASSQLAPVLANCIILKERETLFRDPFSPLEKRLERELQKAMEFHSTLSIVDFRVKNLKKLLGANGMPAMTEFFSGLSRTISRNLFQTDYLTRMGAGRFVLLLPGRGRSEAGIFAERLQLELRQAPLLKGSAVAPAYDSDIINFPDDGNSMQKLIALLDR